MRRLMATIVLITFLFTSIGCYYSAKVPREKLKGQSDEIVKIALIDGRVLEFDQSGGKYSPSTKRISGITTIRDTTVFNYMGREATSYSMMPIDVPIDSVLQVWVKKESVPGTILLAGITGAAAVVALVALCALIIAATKESCPFIYSWDGQKYVFDAEPLGGAICEGLQRSDYSRLEFVVPDQGTYRLKIRNEVPEIQYIDQVGLYVVDHAPKTFIVPDTSGQLHLISRPISATDAIDENGTDIGSFVEYRDELAWQTLMADSELAFSQDTRHHLVFEFPKPAGAKNTRLIVNAGTAIWGSKMIREMLQLRGSGVEEWYQGVNNRGIAAYELLQFNLREEMYVLKLYVQKDSTYVERALIFGGGPFITEDRVINFDVSDIAGEKLTIALNPPKGFWTIDYLAVEYDDDSIITPIEIPLAFAHDQFGQDISPTLAEIDSVRYTMSQVGDWADIGFVAPPIKSGQERSVFLCTTGYYEIQIDKSIAEQTVLIDSLLNTPGAINQYAIDKYIEWAQRQGTSN